MESKFQSGDLVQITATGEIVTINAVSPGMNQVFYLVFQNGKKNRYKESELSAYVDTEAELTEKIKTKSFANAESFQKYAYYRLFSESQDKNIYSYQSNKIIFNPFQYKPLMKFIGIDSDERLLIADEVGVGKTIESGIILDELLARGELKHNDSIMIVCPSILCTKWRNELRNKFLMDDYYIHDGKSLAYMLNEIIETGKIQYPHSIVSEQLFRSDTYQDLLKKCLAERGESFIKMLVIDECHHYRNPGTNTHKLGELISLCSERVIMLSATPFNLRSDDLFNQLHILNPVLFPDVQIFNLLLKQIRNVNQAISYVRNDDSLSKNSLYEYSKELKPIADKNNYISDAFNSLYSKIQNKENLSTKEKVDYERIVNLLNPIASSFTRTLKRDAVDHRVTRDSVTLEVKYTEEESEIYKEFLETNLLRYKLCGVNERAFGLILNGLERIAASSIPALEKNIKKFANMSDDAFFQLMSEDIELDSTNMKAMKSVMQQGYADLLKKVNALGDTDSKFESFIKLVSNIQEATPDNKRIIVFSFYTETLKYLRRRLVAEGYNVALMYGKTPDETPNNQKDDEGFAIIGRNEIMQNFEQGKFEILLVSEVGGEGLDFQFCSSLINYDLPYNPMRIEQRIGRIDRMGQKADKILIGNLCIEDTIDVVINRVLLSRIADAADLVGELEPIIAQELLEINELMITRDFSEEELAKREKEIEQRIEKAKQTRLEFEEARFELVNDKGFRDEFEEILNTNRITPHESLLYTYCFLKKEKGCWCKILSDSSAVIHVTKDICERLKSYNKKMNLGKAGVEIRHLIENEGELQIDFDGNSAYENPNRVFFKPSGPWIHFITDYIRALYSEDLENLFYASINESSELLSKGLSWIFIYEMQTKGFFENTSYEYILYNIDSHQARTLNENEKKYIFQNCKPSKIPNNIELDDFDEIQMLAQDEAEKRKEVLKNEILNSNNIKIGSRIQAIKTLSGIRIRNYEDTLLSVHGDEEAKIRRAIEKEKKKAEEKIAVLEEKLKIVGTYALDAICLLDVC